MKDVFCNEIELTDERWEHIAATHPEMKPHRSRVAVVLSEPDLVKKSRRDENVFLFY